MAKTTRQNSDEAYVLDLCDEILGQASRRQHRFDFLRGDGDPGRKLPVDAYYPELQLVIEYREIQHTRPIGFWDNKPTVSGMPRGQQRARYDQRRRDILPQNGIMVVEIEYSELDHDRRGRLKRTRQSDLRVLQDVFAYIAESTLR